MTRKMLFAFCTMQAHIINRVSILAARAAVELQLFQCKIFTLHRLNKFPRKTQHFILPFSALFAQMFSFAYMHVQLRHFL